MQRFNQGWINKMITLKEKQEDKDQINRVMILDKNENSEKILVIYPSQKHFLFGVLGGFLNRFQNGKPNEILYSGKVEYFETDNKKILSAIKQLNGDKNDYMSLLEYSNAPRGKLEEISFDKSEELVKNGEAQLKQYGDDTKFLLSYKGNLYFKNTFKKAYCR